MKDKEIKSILIGAYEKGGWNKALDELENRVKTIKEILYKDGKGEYTMGLVNAFDRVLREIKSMREKK